MAGNTHFYPTLLKPVVFMRVAGPVFARIFQNILIISQNRGQKWAEGKLYFFGYNFLSRFIFLLYLILMNSQSHVIR